LARMSIGMTIAAASFICSGLLEIWIEYEHLFVAWQLPQYILLGFAEIMVSVTGLEFAYSQAPKSMKGIVMAGWLLTTAIGNAIVAGVAEFKIFSEQAVEFFFYAGLMLVFVLVFLAFTWNYRYISTFDEPEEVPDEPAEVVGEREGVVRRNTAYRSTES